MARRIELTDTGYAALGRNRWVKAVAVEVWRGSAGCVVVDVMGARGAVNSTLYLTAGDADRLANALMATAAEVRAAIGAITGGEAQ